MSLSQQQADQFKKQIHALLEGASTALSETINQTVSADTPEIVFAEGWEGVPDHFEGDAPLMATILLNEPYESLMCLLLKTRQAQIVGDYMLGGVGVPEDDGITDLQMSAAGEAINQMFNSGIAQLSTLLNRATSINSPELAAFNYDSWLEYFSHWPSSALVSIHGSWTITDGSSKESLDYVLIMEENVADRLSNSYQEASAAPPAQELDALQDLASQLMSRSKEPAPPAPAPAPAVAPVKASGSGAVSPPAVSYDIPPMPAPMQGPPVNVQPVQFGSFDQQPNVVGEENRNLSLLMDIRLNLTVELGRTKLTIKDVLELTRGSIIELDRIAGEPVDLYANGKLIARGEVVVIEDNFGLRLTSIVSPADRLKSL